MKTYPIYNYTLLETLGRSGRSMLKEYAAMRKEGMRRYKSLQSGGYLKQSTEIRSLTKGGFPKVSELRGDRDKIMKQLARVSQFLSKPMSTRTGMKQAIKKDVEFFGNYLEDPEFLTKERLPAFYDFLEEFRSAVTAQMYPSEFVFQLWEMGEKVGISRLSLINDVDYWYEHRKEMDLLPTRENKRKISSGMAQKMLNKALKKRR